MLTPFELLAAILNICQSLSIEIDSRGMNQTDVKEFFEATKNGVKITFTISEAKLKTVGFSEYGKFVFSQYPCATENLPVKEIQNQLKTLFKIS